MVTIVTIKEIRERCSSSIYPAAPADISARLDLTAQVTRRQCFTLTTANPKAAQYPFHKLVFRVVSEIDFCSSVNGKTTLNILVFVRRSEKSMSILAI